MKIQATTTVKELGVFERPRLSHGGDHFVPVKLQTMAKEPDLMINEFEAYGGLKAQGLKLTVQYLEFKV